MADTGVHCGDGDGDIDGDVNKGLDPTSKAHTDLNKMSISTSSGDSDYESDYDSDGYKQAYAEYCQKLETTGGFDVDEIKGYVGLIKPVDLEAEPYVHTTAIEMSRIAIAMYNIDNGTNYKVHKIVKVNWEPRCVYHMTFEAMDESWFSQTFQALGREQVTCSEVDFCHIKGTYRDYTEKSCCGGCGGTSDCSCNSDMDGINEYDGDYEFLDNGEFDSDG